MSAPERAPGQWVWRTVRSEPLQVAGSSAAATVVAGQLHVLASSPDGTAANHLRLEGRSLVSLGELPLRTVTGAIDAGSGAELLVCGASPTEDAPVVCRVDASGTAVEVMKLPLPGPVAAWPRLVGTQPSGERYVVWATGGLLDASVWLSEIEHDRLRELIRVLEGVGTYALYAAASSNGVDVLCYGERLDFTRWRGDGPELKRRLETPNDAAATLFAGAVVWPTSSHAFEIWLVDTDEHQVLELPEPPERASAQARHLRLAAAPDQADLLYWETHLPDDFRLRQDDDSSRMVHGFAVRAWLGRLDRETWRVADSVEIPSSTSPPLLTWVDGRLALTRSVSGIVEVTLGERL